MAAKKAYSYIRMSTDLQLRGDSKRRQEELSRAFAATHGLELDDQFDLNDIGISAFKGNNVTSGALGRFLEAVEQGVVEPGSYLLVESLDRLSRQPVEQSLKLFLDIINKGIVIATIIDGQIYKSGELNLTNLIASLVVMQRSFEESYMKSMRISTAWDQKRKNIDAKKFTSMCPGWLRLDKNKNQFDIDEDKAFIVRRIFDYSANGLGAYSIAVTLNSTKTPPFGRGSGWHISSVKKLLKNRAVIGEFQPCQIVDGKRREIGQPIAGYYPAIVDDDLFHRANAGISSRKKRSSGRSGLNVSNLFAGMLYCGYCKSKVRMLNKGNGAKGGKYLICSDSHRRLNCTSTSWRYSDFEELALTYVRELDLQNLLSAPEAENSRRHIQSKIEGLEGQKADIENRISRVYESFSDLNLDVTILADRIRADQLKISQISAEIEEIKAELSTVEAHTVDESTIAALIKSISAPNDADRSSDDIFLKRKSINHHLNRIIDSLSIYPDGYKLKSERSLKFLKEQELSIDDFHSLSDLMAVDTEQEAVTERFFDIMFKNGEIKFVFRRSTGDGGRDPVWVRALLQSRQRPVHERNDYVDSFLLPRSKL